MTSQDSWIDQDEINQLVNSIEGNSGTPAHNSDKAPPLPGAKKSLKVEIKTGPPAPNPASAPVSESAKDTESSDGFVFDLGEGDDTESEDATTSQESFNQPQVVQALAEVRNRANRGGLLKSSFKKGPSPLWPDFPPLDDEKGKVEPTPSSEPEQEIDLEEAEAQIDEQPIPEVPVERPKTLRKRLENFADTTVSKFEATGFSITDFSGYQLLQRGDDDTLALSAAASLVTDQINQLSEAVGAPELGSTQISLGDDRWLCLVEAQSSAGGILAQLQIPEPMTSSATSSFRRDLEAVLAG